MRVVSSEEILFLRSLADQTAREAGALLRNMHRTPRSVESKGRVDLVTDADQASEDVIFRKIAEYAPGSHFLLEESGARQSKGHDFSHITWIADPLDGTTNYASKIPHYAVSIAACAHLDDPERAELLVGVVFDPERGEMFATAKGMGAFLVAPDSLSQLRVSENHSVEKGVFATGFSYDRLENKDDNSAEFCAVNLLCRGVRRNGAAALDLAWVAAGRFDGYWERGLKAWDLAAGALLVQEAGGRVTSYRDQPLLDVPQRIFPALQKGEVLCSNGFVHTPLQEVIKKARTAAGFSEVL